MGVMLVRVFALWVALAAAFPLFAQESSGAEVTDPGCIANPEWDICQQEKRQQYYDAFDFTNPEQVLAERTFAIRALITDEYGRYIAAANFIRAPGATPRVTITGKARGDGKAVTPLTGSVSHAVWSQALMLAANFDRTFAKSDAREIDGQKVVNICLHGWNAIIEVIEPVRVASRRSTDLVRRDTENACDKDHGFRVANQLVTLAVDSLPECDGLAPLEEFGPLRASLCFQLAGDRLAAKDALLVSYRLEKIDAASAVEELRRCPNPIPMKIDPKRFEYLTFEAPFAPDRFTAVLNGVLHIRAIEEDGEDEWVELEIPLTRDFGEFRLDCPVPQAIRQTFMPPPVEPESVPLEFFKDAGD